MPSADYPLVFERQLLEKVWGARRLAGYLNINIEKNARIGESWELSDHRKHQSIVKNGPLAGRSLGELMAEDGAGLAGAVPPARGGRFPLLIKFIDTSDRLSVQVHPSDAIAARLNESDGGKNEAWFFVNSEKDAKIWVGLAPDKKYTDLEGARRPEEFTQCMREWNPEPGDAIAIAAGTIHAIGAGVTVCEVQQTSDITYRVYDWDRPATPDRALHPKQSAASVRGELRPVLVKTGGAGAGPVELPSPGFFRWNVRRSTRQYKESTDGRFRAAIAIAGRGEIACGREGRPFPIAQGDVALIPARAETFTIEPDGSLHWILVEPAPATEL
ncbi:MAG: class I mannose-6-phosphate isomerase [Planctomycetes bacterium]|nr:class I mannose-6-phosphate isomerase [Planctomycetota bacterium]